jgi:hypothetical protein
VKYRVTDSMERINRIGNLVFFLDGAWFTLSRKLNRENNMFKFYVHGSVHRINNY